MRYQRSILCSWLFLFLVAGGNAVRAQDDDTWQVTDSGGTVITPVRSLGIHRDSVITTVLTTRVTRWGDSAVVHRYYEPRAVAIDGLRELRDARPDQFISGLLAGVLGGVVVAGLDYLISDGDADPTRLGVTLLAAPVIGAVVGGVEGLDEVHDLDPLSPQERRTLITGKIRPASADELGIRTIDSTVVVGERALARAQRGKEWRPWDLTAGTGPGIWSRSQQGSNILASRFALNVKSSGFLFTGGVTVSSTRWSDRVVYEWLVGTDFLWDDFRLTTSGGIGFVTARLRDLPGRTLPAGMDPSAEHGSAMGLSLASEGIWILGDFWGISATGYSSISSKGTMFGLALSARIGSLR